MLSAEQIDFFIHFYGPSSPRTSFKMSAHDEAWVPLHNMLRKLTPLELTTATGRSYNISQRLCDEMPQSAQQPSIIISVSIELDNTKFYSVCLFLPFVLLCVCIRYQYTALAR
jgi:hypothetical protein